MPRSKTSTRASFLKPGTILRSPLLRRSMNCASSSNGVASARLTIPASKCVINTPALMQSGNSLSQMSRSPTLNPANAEKCSRAF